MQDQSLAFLKDLALIAASCDVGHRRGLDPALLWLWLRPAAAALLRPLAWELLYAAFAKKQKKKSLFVFFFGLFATSWADPTAHGGSQARDQIGATAAHLCHSHGNTESEPCLRPTPHLMATPEP